MNIILFYEIGYAHRNGVSSVTLLTYAIPPIPRIPPCILHRQVHTQYHAAVPASPVKKVRCSILIVDRRNKSLIYFCIIIDVGT